MTLFVHVIVLLSCQPRYKSSTATTVPVIAPNLHSPLQTTHSFMCSKLSLCLLLCVFYSATVKAFPASPPVQTLALTPFHLHDLDPNLRERADTHFVTIFGLYDNSLHNPTVDSSKPKLAPITEAFMEMTRALATATVTGSGSGSAMHSATPTPLHKAPSALRSGLAIRPTSVQSTVAPSSTDTSKETLETLQLAAKTRTRRLVIFGSVIAGVVCLGLLLFLLLDPRMMRKLCGIKVDDNMHFPTKSFYGRRKPTWGKDVSPISSSHYVFTDEPIGKSFFANKNPVNEKQPISKFSICSSVYPLSSRSTSESEHDADTPRSKTSPVRPPRPPTADSPALSDSVYLACADQPYIIVAPQPFTDTDRNLDNSPAIPTGPKIFSHDFLNMYAAPPSDLNMNSTIPRTQPNPNPTPEFYDTRHSRTYSAPSFIRSMNDQIYNRSEPTVVQRMLKHRRSRSASGWAYPDRPPSKGLRICN